MTAETWCLLGTSILTALAVGRVLSVGRESALLGMRQAEEEAEALRRQKAAIIAELEMAQSDVEAVEG